uniref:Uncharacterized protein n=1 Tax=Caenorhabditis japonica TaxID=281687 RepID=A0A8R1ISI2_CAEJA
MLRHAGAMPPPLLLHLLLLLLLFLTATHCMKFDAERLAARQRIDAKWDLLDASSSRSSRRGRQIQPKEISIQ